RRRHGRSRHVRERGHGGYEDGGYEDQDRGRGQQTGGADELVEHGGWHLPPHEGASKGIGEAPPEEQPGSRGVEALLPLSDAVGGVNTGRQADPRVPDALVAREPEPPAHRGLA